MIWKLGDGVQIQPPPSSTDLDIGAWTFRETPEKNQGFYKGGVASESVNWGTSNSDFFFN